MTQIFINQSVALDNADKLEHSLLRHRAAESAYAGVYIDGNGNLVVNYTSDLGGIRTILQDDSITYRQVNHTVRTLDETNNAFVEILGQYGVKSVEVSYTRNAVIVTLISREEIGVIQNLVDCSAVIFEDAPSGFELTSTATTVTNGKGVGLAGGSANIIMSVGCKVKSATTGKEGFLTTGHVKPTVGSNVYYNGSSSACGVVRQTKFGGYVDATFVETNSSYSPSKTFMNGDSYDIAYVDTSSYGLREGMYLDMYGLTSQKSNGKVLSLDFSGTYEGVEMKRLVKCDYVAVGGDSGGAVVYDRYVGSASTTKAVMGLQACSLLSNGKWVNGTSFSAFSRIDYIFSDLGLSN